jgi:selenoprotein W-related protein
LNKFESSIDSLMLIPSGGGVFEVTVDGDLVFSKKALGRHAEIDEVLKSFEAKL